jgi:hypothetical protein
VVEGKTLPAVARAAIDAPRADGPIPGGSAHREPLHEIVLALPGAFKEPGETAPLRLTPP